MSVASMKKILNKPEVENLVKRKDPSVSYVSMILICLFINI